MRFHTIEGPIDPAVSLDEMKAHLRVDHSADDAQIEALTMAAQAGFESGDFGILRRPVAYQEVEIDLGGCDSRVTTLFGPIDDENDIIIVRRDVAGADVTIDPAGYRIDRANTFSPRLVALSCWPFGNDIRIRCMVGLTEDDPRLGNFKSAIKLHVQKIYDGVEDTSAIDAAISALLAPYRVLSI